MTDRVALLAAYEDLRVADVRDAMDALGYHRVGSMSPEIRPLWRTTAFGVARTCRYLPFRGTIPTATADDYWAWAGTYYRDVCSYPWIGNIEDGDFVVIDQSGVDAGLMGSANTLSCLEKGVRGFVTNGGVRDTDEIILEKVPFWSTLASQSMVQCRLEFDAKDVPVAVGGVQVRPGDGVVADGDGVIVVPSDAAAAVAAQAHGVHNGDKQARRRHYRALGWDADRTVE